MPKQVSHTTRKLRSRTSTKFRAEEEEKENIGMLTTQSRQHRPSGVLGATTTLGLSTSAVAKPLSKGVLGKRNVLQVKEKKVPLQDITSQFLPAPESANRGAGSDRGEGVLGPILDLSHGIEVNDSRHVLASPLPPSSPPPDLLLPTVGFSQHRYESLESIGYGDTQPDFSPLRESETGELFVEQTSSSSDPFGFSALERKLKEERRFVKSVIVDIDEELEEIPVADTSSPRPLPRSKQSLGNVKGAPSSFDLRDVPTQLHFSVQPSTPRKNKRFSRWPTFDEPDIFSPRSSSRESTPSPTKTPASKRRRASTSDNPLATHSAIADENDDKDDDEDDEDADDNSQKRQCQNEDNDHPVENMRRNLRPRRPIAAVEKTKSTLNPPKDNSREKSNRKTKSQSSKKVFVDLKERTRERKERIEYFDRLADYSMEKENVYII